MFPWLWRSRKKVEEAKMSGRKSADIKRQARPDPEYTAVAGGFMWLVTSIVVI